MPPNPITKRRPILQAAMAVFLRSGYGGASMEAIAETAAVSKATLYNQFGGKRALFEAIVRSGCERLLESVEQIAGGEVEPAIGLPAIGRAYVELHYASQTLDLFRLVIAERQSFPELADLVFQSCQEPVRRRLANYLRWLDQRELLRVTDPEAAAQQFLGMLAGETHMRCVLGLRGGPTRGETEALIGAAAALFCAGYAASDS